MSKLFTTEFVAHRASSSEIVITVVMPVFNQEESIELTVDSLVRCLESPNELIFIDDCSEDSSLSKLKKSADSVLGSKNLTQKVTIIRAKKQQFETACDFEGFSRSSAPYILEVQADMRISDEGFDKRMIRALEYDDGLLMVSGRGTHSFAEAADEYATTPGAVSNLGATPLSHLVATGRARIHRALARIINLLSLAIGLLGIVKKSHTVPNYDPETSNFRINLSSDNLKQSKEFLKTGRAGNLGEGDETYQISKSLPKEILYIGQTAMRGPLLFNRTNYLKAGGFDVDKFFLGFDDHELALKGWIKNGFRVGYTPVNYISPEPLGSTRKPKSFQTEVRYILHLFRIQKNRKQSLIHTLKPSGNVLPTNQVVTF